MTGRFLFLKAAKPFRIKLVSNFTAFDFACLLNVGLLQNLPKFVPLKNQPQCLIIYRTSWIAPSKF